MTWALRRLDALDRVALGVVVVWLVWVVVAAALAGRLVSPLSPYLVAPVVGVAGVAAGRTLASKATAWPVAELLLAFSALGALSALLGGTPALWPTGYANANSALGVQLVALVALLTASRPPGRLPGGRPPPATRASYARSPRGVLGLAWVAAVGVVLANGSQAGVALLVPVGGVAAVAAATGRGPWRPVSVLAGAAALASGAAGLAWLILREEWPGWALRGLSWVRQRLWQDALLLWDAHRLTGAGPGSFADTSPLAADPDTSTAHSSMLQVAAELGLVGVGLFGALLLVGLLLVGRRGRAAAVIASAAWAALGVHSFMDHLYEFPALTFTACAVLGWASATASAEPPKPRRAVRTARRRPG